MTLGEQWQGKIGQITNRSVTSTEIAARKIVDVGKILQVYEDGLVLVQLYDITQTTVQCEAVSVGAFGSTLVQPLAGQNCLVFFPSSSVNIINGNKVDVTATPYSLAYAKCLPIGLQDGNEVSISLTEDCLELGGEQWNIHFGKESINVSSKMLLMNVDLIQGLVTYSTADGKFTYSLTPTDFTLALGQNFDPDTNAPTDYTSQFKIDVEGNAEFTQGATLDKETGEATDFKSRLKIDVEGNVEFTQGAVIEDGSEKSWNSKFKLGADGSIDIKTLSEEEGKHQTEITVGTDGNIVLKTLDGGEEKASLKINHDGTISLTTTDAYSISGQAGVVVDGQDGKVSIKNGQKSLYEILKGMLQVLNSSFATQGSPGAHTCIPNQFQTQATDLDALME